MKLETVAECAIGISIDLCQYDGGGDKLLSHRIGVFVSQVAVRSGNQHSAITVPLPSRNGFEIHSQLNGSGDKTSAQRPWREVGKPEAKTGSGQ